jgi:hypothetical protein
MAKRTVTHDKLIEVMLSIAGGAVLLLLGGVGWLVVQTFDLKGKVSSLDTNLTDTNGRVERLASAMPSVVVRLAQQDLAPPAKTVVVATKPFQDSAHRWASTIVVYDVGKAVATTFSLPLSGQYDRGAYTKAAGAALVTERHALSFKDLETDLRSVQDTTQIADLIVANSSFILRSATADQYMASFKAVHGTDSARVKTRALSAAKMTWQSINDDIAHHPDQFRPSADSIPNLRDRRY